MRQKLRKTNKSERYPLELMSGEIWLQINMNLKQTRPAISTKVYVPSLAVIYVFVDTKEEVEATIQESILARFYRAKYTGVCNGALLKLLIYSTKLTLQ